MRLLVAATTILAALAGLRIGYGSAGLGGAILFGALIGVGGALLGALLARTAILLRHT